MNHPLPCKLQRLRKHWPRQHNPGNLVRALCGLCIALGLAGCATPPPPPPAEEAPVVQLESGPVLARDRDYAVVLARAGDDYATLAQRYLGDAHKDWWIAEANGKTSVHAGDAVVIPLRSHNRIGVYPDGYQTVPILCYHRFGARATKLTTTPAAFAAQMEYLAKNGYHVLPLSRITDFLAGKEQLPQKTVVITLDDGYRSTYEIAYPILKKFGFPATVFLYSDFVGAGDALNFAQMKEMSASGLIDIQPHSKTHANLTLRLANESDAKYRERMRREVEAPISVIEDKLAATSVAYAYPYGDVNDTIVDLLTHKGIRIGVTVTPGGNGFFAYPYMLRRSMVFGDEDLDSFKSKLVTFVHTSGH